LNLDCITGVLFVVGPVGGVLLLIVLFGADTRPWPKPSLNPGSELVTSDTAGGSSQCNQIEP
jgi:hypothetical protein